MRQVNCSLLTTATVIALSQATNSIDMSHLDLLDLTATIADVTSGQTNKEFVSGSAEVLTITFPTYDNAEDGDFITFPGSDGNTWAIALDISGAQLQEPTSASWTAIPAGRKVYVNISNETTAADVAAAVETAFDGLTGEPFTTDDSAADGTMAFAHVDVGAFGAGTPYTFDEGGAGSITSAVTTPGVNSDVDLTENTATITAHGYATGLKLQLTTDDTLPTGLSTSTDYYIIVVDDDNVKFASSQANALAGTAVDISGIGGGTHTVEVEGTLAGTIKLQKNNQPKGATAVWEDITTPASQNITAAGSYNFTMANFSAREVRALIAITEGAATADVRAQAKGQNAA